MNGEKRRAILAAMPKTGQRRAIKTAAVRAWRAAWWWASLCLAAALAGCVDAGDGSATPVQQQPLKQRQRIAADMFRQRCQKAGVFIYRTVDNVEGVFLMKIRPEGLNIGNQYVLDDPYGSDLGGDGYIMSFLRGHFEHGTTPGPDRPPDAPADPKGYEYVEAVEPKDGVKYRYTGSIKAARKIDTTAPNVQLELRKNPEFDLNIYDYVLDRTPAKGPQPRYGVTYEDISTRQERDYWIAGSALRVIDLKTNEVIAERIGYMMDGAQGISLGGELRGCLRQTMLAPCLHRVMAPHPNCSRPSVLSTSH